MFCFQPKNIFLEESLTGDICAKVGDFGLARHVNIEETPLTPHPGRKNATGT